MAHASCMLDKEGYTCARTCTRPRVWEPIHTRTQASTHPHTYTHREKYAIFITFPRQELFSESASVLLYKYIA